MISHPPYSIDTSGLIDGLDRFYPARTFPSLWAEVDRLIDGQRLFLSEEVWEEVKVKDLVAKAWCQPRLERLMVPTDASIAIGVQSLLANHPRLVMNMKGRNRADPFVIVVAQKSRACVVTGEGSDGTANRPKIPYICRTLGIECIRFTDLIVREGWTF